MLVLAGTSWQFPAFQSVPRLQHQPPGTVLAELPHLVVLEHAEGFGWVVRAHHLGGVEDVAQLVAREAIGTCVPGIEFGA